MPPEADKQHVSATAKATKSTGGPGAGAAAPTAGRLTALCIAAWLVPGLGHWMLGRRGRAAILFLAIVGMFVLGLLMQGQFFALSSASYLERLGFLGELCAGLPMPVAKFFGYAGGNPLFVSADFGATYLISAGMLNLLAMLDAYDIAHSRKP